MTNSLLRGFVEDAGSFVTSLVLVIGSRHAFFEGDGNSLAKVGSYSLLLHGRSDNIGLFSCMASAEAAALLCGLLPSLPKSDKDLTSKLERAVQLLNCQHSLRCPCILHKGIHFLFLRLAGDEDIQYLPILREEQKQLLLANLDMERGYFLQEAMNEQLWADVVFGLNMKFSRLGLMLQTWLHKNYNTDQSKEQPNTIQQNSFIIALEPIVTTSKSLIMDHRKAQSKQIIAKNEKTSFFLKGKLGETQLPNHGVLEEGMSHFAGLAGEFPCEPIDGRGKQFNLQVSLFNFTLQVLVALLPYDLEEAAFCELVGARETGFRGVAALLLEDRRRRLGQLGIIEPARFDGRVLPVLVFAGRKYHARIIQIIIQMIRSIYSRRTVLAEVGVVVLAVIAIQLQSSAEGIEQKVLRQGVRWVIHVGEAGIAAAIIVAAEFDGGILVLYLLKVIMQASADEFSVGEIVVPAVAWMIAFQAAVVAFVKICRIEVVDFRNKEGRPKFIENEQKRRIVNFLALMVILMGVLSVCLHDNMLNGPFLIYLAIFLGMIYEFYVAFSSEECLSNLVASTLNYQLYLYILLNVFLAQSYLQFAPDMLLYLTLSFFAIRVFIGSKSTKFHDGDGMLFDMVYIFKGDNGHKYYRNNGNSDRILKHMDRLSRELAVIIYFLAFFLTISQDGILALIAAITLINYYPLQNSSKLPFLSQLQKKMKSTINFRPLLSIPIAVLFIALQNRSITRSQTIYDEINGCSAVNHYQTILFSIFFFASLLSQIIERIKTKAHKFVELACPLIFILWTVWLECIHFKHVLLGIYVLAYSFEVIRDGRISRKKGSKKD